LESRLFIVIIRTITQLGVTMDAYTAGTLAGAGSFRCETCGFGVALHERDEIPACPHCNSGRFRRASIFGDHSELEPIGTHEVETPGWLESARGALVADGDYVAFQEDDRVRVVTIQEGWTRIGRSLAAHVRFDDPTVSRRHALLHREQGSVRLLDDRSLNGVFLNGERVDWHELEDGDEVVIGRFRLYFISLAAESRSGQPEEVGSAYR
jgi:DNA-directed RNA polymerase subunit RPC12/RpoP